MFQRTGFIFLIIFLSILGIFFRVFHNDFGLPHSFYADEPEIVELAIKYTYEIKSILQNNDWYKLIPISYVYGTFPSYILTLATTLFSKTLGILNIPFEKMHIYVFLRTLVGLFSYLLIPTISFLYFKLFKNKLGAITTFILLSFNWKLIVHAHYVNADIIITTLLCLSFLTMYLFYKKGEREGEGGEKDTLCTILSGIFYGLAVGTKITVLITLPLYLYIFIKRRAWRNLIAFCFLIIGAFSLSNPFSLIYVNDFLFRIYEMLFKEAGLVFDSVDTNPFKYVLALSFISTLPVFLLSLCGIFKIFKFGVFKKFNSSKVREEDRDSKDKTFHIFLLGNILFYLVFYSLQSRRVDRWLLPILPIVIMYASFGFTNIINCINDVKCKGKCLLVSRFLTTFCSSLVLGYYLFFCIFLLFQFKKNTPKSEAYIWMQENTTEQSSKLIYTEEGLDPMNKLLGERVIKFNVYESEDAQFFLPENPLGYKYVVISSRPMENFKKEEVIIKYPWYAEKWFKFESILNDKSKFEIIKSFELPKPNLIPLSNVYIYENKTL